MFENPAALAKLAALNPPPEGAAPARARELARGALELLGVVDDARAKEADFFREHPAYKDIAAQQGSEFLGKRLSHLLSRHVRMYIPTLRNEILSTMNAVRA